MLRSDYVTPEDVQAAYERLRVAERAALKEAARLADLFPELAGALECVRQQREVFEAKAQAVLG